MPTFLYIASDAEGKTVRGELEADEIASAQHQLAARGLVSIQVTPLGDAVSPVSLSARDAEQVVVVLAEVSDSQLPLADGLRAAAQECASWRVAAALRCIAADVASGYSLESIMTERGDYLPPHVRGLVVAAGRTHRLGLALDRLVEHHRATRENWSQILTAWAYPAIVLAAALIMVALLPFTIIPQFKQLFTEMELKLPAATQAMIALSDVALWMVTGSGRWLILVLVVVLAGLYLAALRRFGPDWLHYLAVSIPVVGPMWQWNSAAAFVRLLGTLLEHGIPLPNALELVGDGIAAPGARDTARFLADGAGQGRSLSEMLSRSPRWPATIVPFVRWGEQTGMLPEALSVVNDLLLTRLRIRAMVLRSIGPPLVFLAVGFLVLFCVLCLFLPMFLMIQGLT